MAQVISIGNQKGGCGKTTTAVNLSHALAMLGKEVLVIDMDPQGNASITFGVNIEDIPISMADILLDAEMDLKYNIFKKGAVSIAPSNPTLNYADERLHTMKGRITRLKDKLETIKGHYDYILIDCPPSIGILTSNALVASDWVIIPADAGFYSLIGIRQFLARIEDVSEMNDNLSLMGVVLTQFNGRSILSKDVREKLGEEFGERLFKTVIRRDVRLAEAPGFFKSVFEHSLRGNGSEDYLNLAGEVLKWRKKA